MGTVHQIDERYCETPALNAQLNHMRLQLAMRCPRFYVTDGQPDDKRIVPVCLFRPRTAWTWLVVEYDPEEQNIFSYCFSGPGPDCDEWGYAHVPELVDTGVHMHTKWVPMSVTEAKNGIREHLEEWGLR